MKDIGFSPFFIRKYNNSGYERSDFVNDLGRNR